MIYYCDSHLHSNNSFDGKPTVKEICEKAVSLGLSAVTITDHMEAPEISLKEKSEYGDMVKQIKKSVSDVENCQTFYKDNLTVLKGMELGEPMHNLELTKQALEIAHFDFILASVHNLKDEQDFYYLDYSKVNVSQLMKRYFNELLDTAQNADFDSLAHLTYPFRYISERTDLDDENLIQENEIIIDEIFKALINRGKALEINTSGLFKKISSTLPNAQLLQRFKELGGEYITIGSDAHQTENIAQGFGVGIEILKECGFDYITLYKNRKPNLIKI